MAIVAKKRGGAFTRGGARESGQKGGVRESGWETRWKRVVPLAVLVVLVALLAWRWIAGRPVVVPYQEGEAGASAAPDPLWGRTASPSELKPARMEPRPQDTGEPPAPPEEHAAARSESSPHQEEESSLHPAGRPEVAPHQGDDEGEAEAQTEPQDEKPPKHFPRETEQLLAIMLSTPPDTEMPPLPHLDPEDERLNADALLALTNSLVIYETDDERVAALKEAVAELKVQLAEAVRNGGSVADVLNEFRDWQNEGVEMRNETIRAIVEVEDDAEAAKALEAANRELEAEGVVPIRPEEVGFESTEEEE